MEEYKQHLLDYINGLESRGYNLVYKEENLDSKYEDGYYKPAIIYENSLGIDLYVWLFDGEIKDCTHPVIVELHNSRLYEIYYYSSELIENEMPINIYRICGIAYREYNQYSNYRTKGFREYCSRSIHNKYKCIYELSGIEKGDISPRCEEFVWSKLKFAD